MHVIVDAFWQGRNRFKNKVNGKYFDDLKKPKACCHLGAVYYGTFKKTSTSMDALAEYYPDLRKMVSIPCEDLDENVGWISSILIHLSDEHDKRSWPDDKVAAWLEEALT